MKYHKNYICKRLNHKLNENLIWNLLHTSYEDLEYSNNAYYAQIENTAVCETRLIGPEYLHGKIIITLSFTEISLLLFFYISVDLKLVTQDIYSHMLHTIFLNFFLLWNTRNVITEAIKHIFSLILSRLKSFFNSQLVF